MHSQASVNWVRAFAVISLFSIALLVVMVIYIYTNIYVLLELCYVAVVASAAFYFSLLNHIAIYAAIECTPNFYRTQQNTLFITILYISGCIREPAKCNHTTWHINKWNLLSASSLAIIIYWPILLHDIHVDFSLNPPALALFSLFYFNFLHSVRTSHLPLSSLFLSFSLI